jgi:hypothetical protein
MDLPGVLGVKAELLIILCNVGTYTPNDTESHPTCCNCSNTTDCSLKSHTKPVSQYHAAKQLLFVLQSTQNTKMHCQQNTELFNVKRVVQIVTTGLITKVKVKGHTICLSVNFPVFMAAFVKMMVTF